MRKPFEQKYSDDHCDDNNHNQGNHNNRSYGRWLNRNCKTQNDLFKRQITHKMLVFKSDKDLIWTNFTITWCMVAVFEI